MTLKRTHSKRFLACNFSHDFTCYQGCHVIVGETLAYASEPNTFFLFLRNISQVPRVNGTPQNCHLLTRETFVLQILNLTQLIIKSLKYSANPKQYKFALS